MANAWGISGYACGIPLLSRLKAVPPPTVRIPDPGNRCLIEPYKWLFARNTEETEREMGNMAEAAHASPLPLKRRGLRRAKACSVRLASI